MQSPPPYDPNMNMAQPVFAQQPSYVAQPAMQAYPMQQQAYPMQVQQPYPMTVSPMAYSAPMTTTATVVNVASSGADDDLLPAILIFVLGWFVVCVWLGGFAYINSPNKTAKVLGIFSIVMYFVSVVCVVWWIIYATVIVSAAVSNAADYYYGYYYYYYDYYYYGYYYDYYYYYYYDYYYYGYYYYYYGASA